MLNIMSYTVEVKDTLKQSQCTEFPDICFPAFEENQPVAEVMKDLHLLLIIALV